MKARLSLTDLGYILQKYLKREEIHLCQLNWTEAQGVRQSKGLLESYNHELFQQLTPMEKDRLRILTGILTGHCRLRSHLY